MQHPLQEPIQSPTPNGTRLLYRHPVHRILGGVCGGLADYLGLDPSLVRILWVVMTILTGGGGFLAYLALWLLLPVGTQAHGLQSPATVALNERNVTRAGVLLVGLGVLWLLANLGILPWLWGALWQAVQVIFWPALLIVAGLFLLNNRGLQEALARWREQTRTQMDNAAASLRAEMQGVDFRRGLAWIRARLPIKRSRTNRMVMGVCGGIGRTLGIDANLVRLVWVAFSLGSLGTGALIYVLVGLLLPEETPQQNQVVEVHDVEIVVQ